MNKKYQQISDTVKADIEKVCKYLDFEIELNSKLSKQLKQILLSPSKRLRSLITILYLRASKIYLLPVHYELLALIELVHNASLIHDDIIDNNDKRRNIKTLNSAFDNSLAVSAGDYLLGIALKKLAKINSSQITEIFANTLQTMCKGEINQYFNKYKKTNINKYLEKTEQKTASLFDCALHCAFIAADTQYTENDKIFATSFGMAFQIRDDLSNVLKHDKNKTSDDIQDGIFNAPLILSDNLKDGIEKTRILLNNYIDKASDCIKNLDNNTYKTAIIELLELMRDV